MEPSLAILVAAGGGGGAPICLLRQCRLHDGAAAISERPAGFARVDAARAALSGTTLAALPSATEGATSVRAFYVTISYVHLCSALGVRRNLATWSPTILTQAKLRKMHRIHQKIRRNRYIGDL